jgi:ATP-dependent Clp protease ATP-binding subunit ClpB
LHHGVPILDEAVVACARFAQRYLTERRMPDKAIDLLDESAARLRIRQVGLVQV